jgi:hypothetical protein
MNKKDFCRKPRKMCPPATPDEHIEMGNETISELELIDNLTNGAVKRLKLVQGEDLKFCIYAQLSWKGGDLLLETQRKKPRVWSSLDRLAKHINSKYGSVPVVELYLWSKESNGNNRRC